MISIHVIFQRLFAVHHLTALGARVAEHALEVDTLHMVAQLDPALVRKVLTDCTKVEAADWLLGNVLVHVLGAGQPA